MNKSEIKDFYIEINHQKVPVTKEVFVAYYNDQTKERMQRIRRSRCMVPNGKGGMRLCDKSSCNECPHKRNGGTVSLDYLHDEYEYEVEDKNENVIEQINKEETASAVRKALSELSEIDRTIAVMTLEEDISEAKVAELLNISQPAVHQRKVKIIGILREKLKDFRK